jgi:hypothetical protein
VSTIPRLKPNPVVDANNPIVVSITAYREILKLLRPAHRQKIGAIKVLRRGHEEIAKTSLNLRDAKNAIERMQDEIDGETDPKFDKRPRVVTPISIAAVVVNTGTEKVEVDLEELQLRVLSEVGTLGLAECGRILELVSVFQAWNEGLQVGVIEGDS